MIRDPYIGMPLNWCNNTGNNCAPDCTDNCKPCEKPDTPPVENNGGGFDLMYLGSLPLAMCYVPNQQWKTTYPLDKALMAGTIFPELDLPFMGGAQR